MKTADCEKLATHFFLQQQGWSSYILPISILAGVFAYARLARKTLNMKSWTIIVVVILVTYGVLNILSRMLISNAAFRDFVDHCHRCQMDPYCGGPRELSIEDVLSYTGRQENFEDENPEGVDEENTIDREQQPAAADPAVQTNATPENDIAEEESPVDNISANEMETFTDFAPYDSAFPTGTFRHMENNNNWAQPPMQTEVVNDNRVPQTQATEQQVYGGPTIYNSQWASVVMGNQPQGGFEPSPANAMCMSFLQPCESKCSGDAAQNAQCADFVAPVPGPTWQPQRAAVVQARLAAGDYTPATCPLN